MQKEIIQHIFFLVLFAAGISYPAVAQQTGEISYEDRSELPAGITGERIEAAVAAVNADNAEAILRFFENHCTEGFRDVAPMERHVSIFRGFYRETGGVTFHSVRTYTPPRLDQTAVVLRDELYGGWRAIIFEFDETEEGRIAGMQFAPARTPSNVEAPGPLTEAEMVADVAALMDRLCAEDAFSGTLLIARGEQVLLERACGEASKRFGVANKLDTKFNLGSMNKMFTSVAVAQLAEKGVLSNDDPINKYVDESWLPDSITSRVTVHHLLSHTSGLGSYFNDTYWESSRDRFRQLEDYKPLIQGETLAFEPGSEFRYSNTGMFLLGVIIEAASGENYFNYVQKHVHEPAGMTNTACYEMDRPVPNLAIGYVPDPDNEYGWQNNLYLHVLKGGPAGGGFSTVRDLHRFALALQSGKLVGETSLEKLWTDQTGARYGYGFSVEGGPAGKVVGHGGGFPGLNSNLDIFLDKGYIVAVLSNYDRGAGPVGRYVYGLIGQRLEAR